MIKTVFSRIEFAANSATQHSQYTPSFFSSSSAASEIEAEVDAPFSTKAPMDKLKTIQTRCETILDETDQKARLAYKEAKKSIDSMNDEKIQSSDSRRAGQIARAAVLTKNYPRIKKLAQTALNIAQHVYREEAFESTKIALPLAEMVVTTAVKASEAIDQAASKKAQKILQSIYKCIQDINSIPWSRSGQREEEIDFEDFDNFNLVDYTDEVVLQDNLILNTALDVAEMALLVADDTIERASFEILARAANRHRDVLSVLAQWNIKERDSLTRSGGDSSGSDTEV